MKKKKTYDNKAIVELSKTTFMCKMPTDEVLEALLELTENAFRLLCYYYTKSTGWEFSDAKIAEALNLKTDSVGVRRRELINKGYLHISKGKDCIYFVGKRKVNLWLKNRSNTKELKEANQKYSV